MINYKEKIAGILVEHIDGLTKEQIYEMVESPSDSKMGDYAFPCFKLAKVMRKSPALIAEEIVGKINDNKTFEKVENVNAYVNIYLDKEEFAENVLHEVITAKEDYGKSDIGGSRKIIVEYSSPNIAKPFHIGHIRSTVIGNSIYKIYNFLGYDTIRINHLGDYGTQFGKMICAYRRWGNKEEVVKEPIKSLLAYYVKFHDEAKKDPSLEDEARSIFVNLEKGEPEELELWQWFREESLKEFNRVYDLLGIEFDSYKGESFYSDKMPRFVNELKDSGLLIKDDGAQIVRLDEYDLSPALIMKSDGSTLYITRDIAAAVYRKETYDFYRNIYVVAAQQNLHFKQWIKVIELLGYDWAKDCVHVPFGLVSMAEGTMATREGRVVFLEDVLNRAIERTKDIIKEKDLNADEVEKTAKEVGIGAVVFNELSNYRIKDYVFSWDNVLNFEGETGPYVQYTHARACSVLKNSKMAEKIKPQDFDSKYITGESAHKLINLIYSFPKVVVEAGEKYEPSVIARHIIDIAQGFNKFYHEEHILVDDENEKKAKLTLVMAAKITIRNGLELLGMKAPERM